jgi:UDP-N-acetyl-D-mannosaminuronic acid dehydrogenase
LSNHKPDILIIGLGQIGYSNAEYMNSRGLRVDGYDIDAKAVQRALQSGIIEKRAQNLKGYNYYVICVSTHNRGNMFFPSLDGLLRTAHRLSCEGKKGALVTIESTITKGMSSEVNEILGHRLHVAHVPHRYYANEKKEHGVRQIRVLGGCKNCCTRKASHFYHEVLDIPVYVVSSVELAELSKVVENSHRFLEIAFAEELKMFCDGYEINFDELRSAVNTKWNVKILEAKQGIGGHCLPKDTQMYVDLSKHALTNSIIDTAKTIDAEYKLSLPQMSSYTVALPATTVDAK